MITLYGAVPMWGLPDPSPFVTKAEVLIKMAGQPYERRMADFAKAPRGKVPYIKDGETIIPDSTLIRFHLEKTYGIDFNAGLTAQEAAIWWAVEKMCEDHLYWVMVMERWGIPANFEKGPKHFFDDVPAPIRPLITWMIARRVRRALHGQGASRYTVEDRRLLVERALSSIATLLEGRDFAGGDKPCGADATLFAFLQGMTIPFFESVCPPIAAQYPVLGAYVDRMKARFYPEG